jgi:hypothetical protein
MTIALGILLVIWVAYRAGYNAGRRAQQPIIVERGVFMLPQRRYW